MSDLALCFNAEAWRLYSLRNKDTAFCKFQEAVIARDNSTCYFCGFQARRYNTVVNLDGNYRNNKISNMTTACCFCSQCLFIDNIENLDFAGGYLIYSPDLSQREINSLCHVLFCAISNNTGYKQSGLNLYRTLKESKSAVDEKFGTGASDPIEFVNLLLESEIDVQKINNEILKDLKLLPSQKAFATQISAWAEDALKELEEEMSV